MHHDNIGAWRSRQHAGTLHTTRPAVCHACLAGPMEAHTAPPALSVVERRVPQPEGSSAGTSSSEDTFVSALGWNSMDELFTITDGKVILKWEGSGSSVNQVPLCPPHAVPGATLPRSERAEAFSECARTSWHAGGAQ